MYQKIRLADFKGYLKTAYYKLKSLDWKNPRIILTAAAIIILPFVAKIYVMSGMLLGIALAIAVLWVLEKAPNILRRMIVAHPFIADLVLSSAAVMTLGGFFGSGLVLGMGAVFCGIVLSYGLMHIKVDPEPEPLPA